MLFREKIGHQEDGASTVKGKLASGFEESLTDQRRGLLGLGCLSSPQPLVSTIEVVVDSRSCGSVMDHL